MVVVALFTTNKVHQFQHTSQASATATCQHGLATRPGKGRPSRTSYEDWDDPQEKRHLLRLWLACPGGPDLPAVYEEQQGFNADGRPMGIHCPGVEFSADLTVTDGGAGATETRLKQPA